MIYYVYIYLNPLKPGNYKYKKFNFNFEPFYIGMGKKNRIHQHIIRSKYNYRTNLHMTLKENTILKILKNNQEPIIFKLYDKLTIESAIRLEKCIIKLIGRRDIGLGPLSNLTDGGEGTKGTVLTEIQRKNISIRFKKMWKDGVYNNRDMSGEKNYFFNKHHTEETKEKIRNSIGDRKGENNSNYGKKWSDEQKNLASIKQKETHLQFLGENNPAKRPEVREILSLGKMGNKNPNSKKWLLISPENKEFIIDGGIKRNLKKFKLDYQQFKINDKNIRINKKGWQLKEF